MERHLFLVKLNKNFPPFQEIEGYVFSPFKCLISMFVVVITGGLFSILLTWRSDIKLNCLYRKVALYDAKKILLKVSMKHVITALQLRYDGLRLMFSKTLTGV